MKSNFLLNEKIGRFSIFIFFYWACSYRTPKSFACLRSLVTHSIKVYKIVNYRKYIILISYVAVQIFPKLHLCWQIMPKPVNSGDHSCSYFQSLSLLLSKCFLWYNHDTSNSCMFCLWGNDSFLGDADELMSSKIMKLTQKKLRVATAAPKPALGNLYPELIASLMWRWLELQICSWCTEEELNFITFMTQNNL